MIWFPSSFHSFFLLLRGHMNPAFKYFLQPSPEKYFDLPSSKCLYACYFSTLEIPLLCKPHPFFKSQAQFKFYFSWPFQVQMPFWIPLVRQHDLQGTFGDLELEFLGSNPALEMWFFWPAVDNFLSINKIGKILKIVKRIKVENHVKAFV